jgi:hypothetical protein
LTDWLTRFPALLAVLALALIPAEAQPTREQDTVQRVEIHAQSIEAFDSREPSRTRFGALTFRGGLVLESKFPEFGGISSLHIEADGQRFLALSDRGFWLHGRIVYRDKTPIAIADAEMAPALGPDGRPLKRRGWYDTESLAVDGSTAYVGIERVQEIVRFDLAKGGLRAQGSPIAVPRAVRTLPFNQSIECLALASKDTPKAGPPPGSLILLSEQGLDAQGNLLSFVIGNRPATFSLKRRDSFDISDCAIAPGGRLLVLERRFSWSAGVAMRIRSIPLASIKQGALVDGPELIFADNGAQIDNMEGISVHRDADGTLVLTLVSDDNFSALQRTLLLQFTLAAE